MPFFLKIRLTELEKRELKELEKDSKTPSRTKQRIEILRLSEDGLKVGEIAKYKKVNETTVRRTIKRWLGEGKEGLFDQARPGRKKKWKEEDISYLEECLQEERTYNSEQLRLKLREERKVELSRDRIRKILKKKTGNGKEQKRV